MSAKGRSGLRPRIIIVLALLSGPVLAHDSGDAMSACRTLVYDYAYYRDRLDAEGFASIFTEDAVLILPGEKFTGRNALRQRLVDVKGKPISRHLMSTIKIIPIDATTAHGVSYVEIYVEPASETRPAPTTGFIAVGEYHDVFELTEDGWRIARREFVPVLAPASS